ncbi:hypothetical protein OESDEN_08813 [Oesophagostomum dentatum]|uniref:Uncharacterized protein n=1 Tax=Oesophagostomum dentatum TaxID=61180 RepID=A0A0B1T249_OESDE|nr:hypothetical protein OESDEN_08813 [Oesophagostomum dentatum]
MNNGRVMLVCRYRIVFDFGTLNLFLINDSIRRWRVALDEIIDRYSQLYYERSEESCLAAAKRSFVSRCEETQPSSVMEVSAVHSESPTILTLETSPSRKSFKGSPRTKSSRSSRDRTAKEPQKSVRQGKRSVASLRARIQRKIWLSTFGASKHKHNSDTSIACQVTESELLQVQQMPTARRRENDRMIVEPLVTISETSTSSAPPLPANPPPSLSSSNSHYTPSKNGSEQLLLQEAEQFWIFGVPLRNALGFNGDIRRPTDRYIRNIRGFGAGL